MQLLVTGVGTAVKLFEFKEGMESMTYIMLVRCSNH